VLTNFETAPFLRFGTEVGDHFEGLVVFGREVPEEAPAAPAPARTPAAAAAAAAAAPATTPAVGGGGGAGRGIDHPLPAGVELAPLPFYPSLADLGAVAGAMARLPRALWRGLDDVDAVWCFGPHPFSLLLALLALVRRRKVVLGVRQDTMRYFRARLRGRAGRPLLGPLWLLDAAWRALGRRVPVTVVGEELERRYGGPRPGVLSMQISLVRDADVADAPRVDLPESGVELLTVGRIDVEKNPLLLVDALADLGPGWRLTWVGTGPLAEAVAQRAREHGVAVELPGFVAPGPDLVARYRAADAFVHVALTEGVPQVLMEAMATGLPVVATAVGGVASALRDGEAGLLVPPDDRGALVAAVRELAADREGRAARATRGLDLARARTLEAEGGRVAAWLRAV
jgi:glycosyltransferase involved in cell wall biosynthesis